VRKVTFVRHKDPDVAEQILQAIIGIEAQKNTADMAAVSLAAEAEDFKEESPTLWEKIKTWFTE
jgi:hypothetical protein